MLVEVCLVVGIEVIAIGDSIHWVILASTDCSDRNRLLNAFLYFLFGVAHIYLNLVKGVLVVQDVVSASDLLFEIRNDIVRTLQQVVLWFSVLVEIRTDMVSIVASTGAFVSEPVQGKQVFDSLRLPLKVSFLLGPVVRKSLHAVRDSFKALRVCIDYITLRFELLLEAFELSVKLYWVPTLCPNITGQAAERGDHCIRGNQANFCDKFIVRVDGDDWIFDEASKWSHWCLFHIILFLAFFGSQTCTWKCLFVDLIFRCFLIACPRLSNRILFRWKITSWRFSDLCCWPVLILLAIDNRYRFSKIWFICFLFSQTWKLDYAIRFHVKCTMSWVCLYSTISLWNTFGYWIAQYGSFGFLLLLLLLIDSELNQFCQTSSAKRTFVWLPCKRLWILKANLAAYLRVLILNLIPVKVVKKFFLIGWARPHNVIDLGPRRSFEWLRLSKAFIDWLFLYTCHLRINLFFGFFGRSFSVGISVLFGMSVIKFVILMNIVQDLFCLEYLCFDVDRFVIIRIELLALQCECASTI